MQSLAFVRAKKQPAEVFYKKGVLKNFTKLTGKYLCQSLLINKAPAHRLQLYQKRDSGTGVFLVKFVKFLKTPFLQNTFGRPLLRVLQKLFIL